MSNISRRDFLKTAGVMTLAVAAAGVLAGCNGNAPEAPEAPMTGKVPGEITKLGDVEFSVAKAVEQDNVKYTYANGAATDSEIQKAYVRLQVTVRNTKLGTDKLGVDPANFVVYVDGEQAKLINNDLSAAACEKVFGVKEAMQPVHNMGKLDPSTTATSYHASFGLKVEDGVVKKPTAIKVVYKDVVNMIVAEYDIPTPLTVVNYEVQ